MSEPVIDIPATAIAAICREHHVRALWLFGSASGIDDARAFRPDSDVDILVEFEPLPEGRIADSYFALRAALTGLLNRRVDLVTVRAMTNPYFAQSVHATKVPLYAAA